MINFLDVKAQRASVEKQTNKSETRYTVEGDVIVVFFFPPIPVDIEQERGI